MLPCVLYADERNALLRLLKEHSNRTGGGCLCGRRYYMVYILEDYLPDYDANARYGCRTDSPGNLERCHDTSCYYVRYRSQHIAFSTVDIPDTVRYELQPGICLLPAGAVANPDLLPGMPEADHQRCRKRCGKIISNYTFQWGQTYGDII